MLISPASSMNRVEEGRACGRSRPEVERVDRDAVPAQAGAGIERLEPERLGLRRLDHLPDVDPHPIEEDLQLVDQRDVHGPIRVLEDLARLGDLGRRDGDDPDDHPPVERRGDLQARGVETADDLGDRRGRERRVARVFALGAEGEEEVRAGLESRPPPPGSAGRHRGSCPGRSCSRGPRAGRAGATRRRPRVRGDHVGEVRVAGSVSGVGTQMMMASASASRSNRPVASNPAAFMAAIEASAMWPM